VFPGVLLLGEPCENKALLGEGSEEDGEADKWEGAQFRDLFIDVLAARTS
jgi:hypothetical protein